MNHFSSPSQKLLLKIEQHTAWITVANPPANTWDVESLGGLRDLVRELSGNSNIWSLVVSGSGEKFFSAGADLKLFSSGEVEMARRMSQLFGEAFEALSDFPGLSIAAVNGYAMGGGLEAALACDLRIFESHAQVALPEATVGLLPCAGGTQNLPWIVGEAIAKRMMLLGERLSAQQALACGLADAVVDKGQSLALAKEWILKSEKQSPSASQKIKRLIHAARYGSPRAQLPGERAAFVDLFGSHDQKEGVNAFLEKRAAVWRNA
jgi:enoyl-CoA hydratase/carnithine racemase